MSVSALMPLMVAGIDFESCSCNIVHELIYLEKMQFCDDVDDDDDRRLLQS